jgi:phosphoglycerate dehydrogenase-like enzyme
LINDARLARMQPHACLINVARGALVDEPALLAALRDGRLAAAALDVFEHEPLPADSPFWDLPNVLLTPHIGYVTAENLARMYTDAVEDILAFLDGNPVRVLNKI